MQIDARPGSGNSIWTIRNVLVTAVALLSVFCFCISGYVLYRAAAERATASSAASTNDSADLLLAAAGHWARERGATNLALNAPGVPTQAQAAAIASSRSLADQNFNDALGRLSGQMFSGKDQLSKAGSQTAQQSGAVATTTAQASVNIQTVASAAEELSASINEIGRQITDTTRIASEAVDQTHQTNTLVEGLAQAANKIGEVVKLIDAVASQTNLLALNATIEAARAGEAGRGFAVVAAEGKALAAQTSHATGEIASRVSAIQTSTGEAVDVIRQIGATIERLNGTTNAIAAAIEEQGSATQEIARNVQQVAQGTNEISSNISGVTASANETGTVATSVLKAARSEEHMSEL